MTYTAFIGFTMMIIITYLLLKKKVSTLLAFGVVPIIGAILIGSSLNDIAKYVTKGLDMTLSLTMIMLFSLPYFKLMDDTGLFNTIVKWLLKHTKLQPITLAIISVIIPTIIEIDGSVISAYVITIPLLLPLYKKLKMDPKVLLFLCSAGMCFDYILPWNARTLRGASLLKSIDNAPNFIFSKLIPIQIAYLVVLIMLAIILAKIQMKKGAGLAEGELDNSDLEEAFKETELSRPKMFLPNLILTILVVVGLIVVKVPNYFMFALGLVLALAMNYRDLKLQNKLLSKYAAELYPTAPAVLLSGVVVGVLQESGMMDQMVNVLVNIIPTGLGAWVYIIIALIGAPLMFVFTNDTWYYALIPIIAGICNKFGVPTEFVVLALMMNIGAMVSPVAQPQIYLACDLADHTELADFVRFAFPLFWILTVIWVVLGMVLRIFV
ncbi:SLC13 family permease [Clostridium sp. SHJSY1]|uniref:SLC13 family permease n=1 Tax=Clostridium sp. SHJSY1 TaxID=2942483 RepID=UPI0028750B13|nr:SLC13 family permease [Clostridium sp. SHJSY1]MDS0528188.1 SLC13 family permease [Clostridium sp. SHJSY1]